MATSTSASSSLAQQMNSATTPLADYVTSDFNADATSDILWHNTSGETGVWYTTSSGGFSPVDFGLVDPSWTPVGTGDFNASGRAGILWRNSNGEVGEWLNNGSGTGASGFTPVDLGNVSTSWVTQGTGDFNGDGTSDILWRNTNGDTGVWYTTSTGGYTATDLGMVDPSWTVQGIGDFNASNRSGILWRNTNGEVGYWINNGGSGAAGFTPVDLGNVSTNWVIQGVGDFNGDATSDILWRDTTTGDVALWFVNSSGGFTGQDLGPVDSSWTIQSVGDYNASGRASILWRNTTTGDVGEWLSNGGQGFNGFTAVTLTNVSPTSGWDIVGGNPPAVVPTGSPSPAGMAHAMAGMSGSASAHGLVHTATTPQTTTSPSLATPGLITTT